MYSTTARSFLCGSAPSDRPAGGAGAGGVADQVDSEKVGQGLGSQPAAAPVSHQLLVDCQHRGAELWEVKAVERGDHQPRRVEFKRLGGDPCDQLRLQEDE